MVVFLWTGQRDEGFGAVGWNGEFGVVAYYERVVLIWETGIAGGERKWWKEKCMRKLVVGGDGGGESRNRDSSFLCSTNV